MAESFSGSVNGNQRLVARGRFVNTRFLVEAGEKAWLVTVAQGRIADVVAVVDVAAVPNEGPLVMPAWSFALRFSEEGWRNYAMPRPPAGSHDLFALMKRRALKVEGDLHPFMANLFYFKAVMAEFAGANAS